MLWWRWGQRLPIKVHKDHKCRIEEKIKYCHDVLKSKQLLSFLALYKICTCCGIRMFLINDWKMKSYNSIDKTKKLVLIYYTNKCSQIIPSRSLFYCYILHFICWLTYIIFHRKFKNKLGLSSDKLRKSFGEQNYDGGCLISTLICSCICLVGAYIF